MAGFEIVPFAPQMAGACAAIAQNAPDPWGLDVFERLPGQPLQRCFVAVADETPIGFACFLAVAETADLQLVAVAPENRRQGVARALLAHAFEVLPKAGVERVLLEVRQSNQEALALYRAFGFKTLAQRKGMYTAPKEDGFLMALVLDVDEKP